MKIIHYGDTGYVKLNSEGKIIKRGFTWKHYDFIFQMFGIPRILRLKIPEL